MKKMLFAFASFLLLLSVCGCARKGPAPSVSSKVSSAAGSTPAVSSKPVQGVPSQRLDIPPKVELAAVLSGSVIYQTDAENTSTYWKLQPAAGKSVKIGELKNWDTDSQDFAVTNDRYIYRMPSIHSQSTDSLFQIDTQENRVTKVLDVDSNVPLCYLDALNSQNLLVFNPKNLSNGFEYRVFRASLADGQKKLLKSAKFIQASSAVQESIPGAACRGGHIFVLDTIDNQSSVLEYDSSFRQVGTTAVPGLPSDGTSLMKIHGNVFYFEQLTESSRIFLQNGSSLKPVWVGGSNLRLVRTGREYDQSFPYVLFFERNTNFLYAVSHSDGSVARIACQTDPGYENITDCRADEKGNTVFKCCKTDDTDARFYLLKSADILSALKHAEFPFQQ